MPTEGVSKETLALKNDLPFRVNSDGWGDVWIETASGRRIGDLDRRIDADELNEAFALAARAEGPAPPGGGVLEALERFCFDSRALAYGVIGGNARATAFAEVEVEITRLRAALTQPETPDHG